MTYRSIAISCIAIVFFIAGPLAAATFEYSITSYPKTGGDCHTTARELGRRFEQASSLTVKSAMCKAESEHGYDVSIQYDATAQVEEVSTDSVDAYVYKKGGFETPEECQFSLPAERERFKQHTKLDPWLSYCFLADADDQFGWDSKVVAFGATQIVPQLGGLMLWGMPTQGNDTDLLKTVKQSLVEQGIDASYSILRWSLSYGRISIRYYDASPIPFGDGIYTKLATAADCERQIPEMREVFRSTGSTYLAIYCARVLSVDHYELTALVAQPEKFHTFETYESYLSLADCEANRNGIITRYRDEIARPVITGLCSRNTEDAKYHVIIVEHPTTR